MKVLIVIPVFNEEQVLEKNIEELFLFLKKNVSDSWQIVIADNGSKDKTGEIGKKLREKHQEIEYFFLPQAGRGRALRAAWQKYSADIFSFMDADLSADLSAFPILLQAIKEGWDIAIGSRFTPESSISRSWLRETSSRVYNFLLKLFLKIKVKDAQCGFKAINQKTVKYLLPQIKNQEWFFDTELLFLAEKNHYKIKEIPVQWIEQRNKQRKSKVKVISLSLIYLKEIYRLLKKSK